MDVSKADLDAAVASELISAEQADKLWSAWQERAQAQGSAARQRFDFVHVAYYFGALLVIGAMGWFMTEGWERLGGEGICAVAVGYALCFFLTGRALWKRSELRVPGGLLLTMAVAMTPLAIYGLERALGAWPESDPGVYRGFHEWIRGGWFFMELATIGVGALALYFFRFPFLVSTIAFTAWYLSMDLVPLIYGPTPFRNAHQWVSVAVGVVILLVGFWVDRRTRQDFAFWLYLFGLLAFSGGLSAMDSDHELGKFVYLLIHLALIVKSLVLKRRTFLVFGTIGVFASLEDLAYHAFRDSLVFPFVLSLIGIAIIALGVHTNRHRARYEQLLLALIPPFVRRLLPPERA